MKILPKDYAMDELWISIKHISNGEWERAIHIIECLLKECENAEKRQGEYK